VTVQNVVKKIILLVAVIIFSFPTDKLCGQQLPQDMVVNKRFATVRKGPGTGYDKVATLYQGDHVRAEKKYRNWLRVSLSDGTIGWVNEDLLDSYRIENRPLIPAQADSLKTVVDSQNQRITQLEDSAKNSLTMVRENESRRDSLLKILGLSEVPSPDTLGAKGKRSARTAGQKPLQDQQSVLTVPKVYAPRYEFSPVIGVLILESKALTAAGFSVTRTFTSQFAYGGEILFSRSNPPSPGALGGDVEHVFINGGLIYSYKPGNIAVPFAELGAGASYTQAGDSSTTALDLVFGAGCRLFLTPDLALKFGYRGQAILDEGNKIAHLFYLGCGLNLPRHKEQPASGKEKALYLSPYLAFQMFSPRFRINSTTAGGLRLGYRMRRELSFELLSGYLPVVINEGRRELSLSAAELAVQVLYSPWPERSSPYFLAGGGEILFAGDGRPPAGTRSYGFFLYGGGVNLELAKSISLRSEMAHLIFPNVADIKGRHEVSAGGALRLAVSFNMSF